jgi:hypothetical protein
MPSDTLRANAPFRSSTVRETSFPSAAPWLNGTVVVERDGTVVVVFAADDSVAASVVVARGSAGSELGFE